MRMRGDAEAQSTRAGRAARAETYEKGRAAMGPEAYAALQLAPRPASATRLMGARSSTVSVPFWTGTERAEGCIRFRSHGRPALLVRLGASGADRPRGLRLRVAAHPHRGCLRFRPRAKGVGIRQGAQPGSRGLALGLFGGRERLLLGDAHDLLAADDFRLQVATAVSRSSSWRFTCACFCISKVRCSSSAILRRSASSSARPEGRCRRSRSMHSTSYASNRLADGRERLVLPLAARLRTRAPSLPAPSCGSSSPPSAAARDRRGSASISNAEMTRARSSCRCG